MMQKLFCCINSHKMLQKVQYSKKLVDIFLCTGLDSRKLEKCVFGWMLKDGLICLGATYLGPRM